MKVYLVQHGVALDASEDPLRPLSAQGADSVRKISHWLQHEEVKVSQIHHSKKLRAKQTAEILAEQLVSSTLVTETDGLGANDDIEHIIETIISGSNKPLMLVGHLPFLNHLLSQLVVGQPETALVRFHNAAIICLKKIDTKNTHGAFVIDWIVPPELIP